MDTMLNRSKNKVLQIKDLQDRRKWLPRLDSNQRPTD